MEFCLQHWKRISALFWKASEAGWMLYCYGTIKNGEVFLMGGGPREIIVTWDGMWKAVGTREYKRFRQSFACSCFSFFFSLSPWSKEIYWFLPVKLLKETLSPYVHTGYKSILPKSVVQIWNCSFSCFIAPARPLLDHSFILRVGIDFSSLILSCESTKYITTTEFSHII